MYIDPVIQEIRRNGAEFAEECNGDVHVMAERLRQAQQGGNRRVVTRRVERRDDSEASAARTRNTSEQGPDGA